MKLHYKLIALSALAFFMTSCQDDEVLNLEQFPENHPQVNIDGTEGEATATVYATYQSDGSLALDGRVSRDYNFEFTPSPEKAYVYFDVVNLNIPEERISINKKQVELPAGFVNAGVSVTLKDEDFSFARDNYKEETYELGVKATTKGYNISSAPVESKVIIKKEAYKAACYIQIEDNQRVKWERTFAKGSILEEEPITFQFKVKLDKPARHNVKVTLDTEGIKDLFKQDVTISPNKIIIPAGKVSSEVITWTINNKFLMETTKAENFNITVKANFESSDEVVYLDETRNTINIQVNKTTRNIGYLEDINPNWQEIKKDNWGIKNLGSAYGVESIIDGNPETLCTSYSGELEYIIDLKSPQDISGFGFTFAKTWGSLCGVRRIMVSTSNDNEEYTLQGNIYRDENREFVYVESYETIKAQYIKMKVYNPFDWMVAMSELYIYK